MDLKKESISDIRFPEDLAVESVLYVRIKSIFDVAESDRPVEGVKVQVAEKALREIHTGHDGEFDDVRDCLRQRWPNWEQRWSQSIEILETLSQDGNGLTIIRMLAQDIKSAVRVE